MRTLLLICGLISTVGCGDVKLADPLDTRTTQVSLDSAEFVSQPLHSLVIKGKVLPQRRYNVVAPNQSPVVYVRNEGDRLGRGEILMQFSTDQLALEKQRIEQALLVERENRALRERLMAIESQIASSLIRAPFDMVITSNSAVVGNQYNENTVLLEGIEEGPSRIAAMLPRWFADQVKQESNVDLDIDQKPVRCGVEIENAQSQNLSSLLGYFTILSEFGSIQPSQTLEIEIESTEQTNGYWFPIHAVRMDSNKNNFVYVVEQAETEQNDQLWFVKKLPVNLVSRKGRQVFGQSSNFGLIRFVSDGTHRIVNGQKVEITVND